jgi:hypothetical protein
MVGHDIVILAERDHHEKSFIFLLLDTIEWKAFID